MERRPSDYPHDGGADGTLTLNPSPRGWQMTARLAVDRLPTEGPMGSLAVELFRFCDRNWGTDFGELEPPFGMRSLRTPSRTRPDHGRPGGRRPADGLSPGGCSDGTELHG
jgi:hypothetical protein